MLVIADSTALVVFARIAEFDLLRRVYGRVTIPGAVFDEVVVRGADRPGAQEVSRADWIDIVHLNPSTRLDHTLSALGRGEAEVIALAGELDADAVLIDDRHGRLEATRRGWQPIGCLGVLIQAKSLGEIAEIGPLLQQMTVARFYLTQADIDTALEAAGELPPIPHS